MHTSALIITSIAGDSHPVLRQYAEQASRHGMAFIVVGDTKSPTTFSLPGCDFYSLERQLALDFELVQGLPVKHYARKNLGYLAAIRNGAEVIVETDDDNLPLPGFWDPRSREHQALAVSETGWTNVYRHFSESHIWPRGFALEEIQAPLPEFPLASAVSCPIQQGLADENPDVDAIYRLTLPLPLSFKRTTSLALGSHAVCPFNSQNTTWFKEAFPLLYLPSYCSFRMTDIWRSFIAQRISWTCGWSILFHNSTVRQERNDHNLMHDFQDEISGYANNFRIVQALNALDLAPGVDNIPDNLVRCYQALVDMELIGAAEMPLLTAWLADLAP